MAYSPFMGFEHPDALAELVTEHGGYELADALAILRGEQGMPLSRAGDVIAQAVAGGLLMAPSVDTPGGGSESFPVLPYSVDPGLLRERKPVLEKALAVISPSPLHPRPTRRKPSNRHRHPRLQAQQSSPTVSTTHGTNANCVPSRHGNCHLRAEPTITVGSRSKWQWMPQFHGSW
jgi:hypothetical protein